MKINYLLMTCAAILALSCNSKLEDPTAVPEGDQLQGFVDKPAIKWAGQECAVVSARIPKDAGLLDISFTTTAGSFLVAKAKSAKQQADSLSGSYRYASLTLESDSTVGKVYLTLEAGTQRKRILINFEK